MRENTGTVVKLNVNVSPIDGHTLKEMDFSCAFFVSPNRAVNIGKGEMMEVDESNYLAIVDTRETGPGEIMARLTVQVPDADCEGGIRTEIGTFPTGVTTYR